jgi:hypothetical protein
MTSDIAIRTLTLVLVIVTGCELTLAKDKPGKVRGAMWHVVAENAETGKKEKFKFRAHDGIIYDTVNEKAGGIDPIALVKPGEMKSKIVFKGSLPLHGDMVISQRKKGVWSGVLKADDGAEWKCLLEVTDR